MSLKSIIDEELKRQHKTFKWLVGEIGISNDGLKSGLENETIKLKDFKKLIQVLQMPIQTFIAGDITLQSQKGGKHNTQAAHSLIMNEPGTEYRNKTIENLEEQVRLLKSQLADKDTIIALLKNK